MGNQLWRVLGSSLKLGLTSFGGPIAHLAYFRQEYVVAKKWLDEDRYAEFVALAQFLPGPASSQVGMAVGWLRAGWLGAVAAWIGFTLPSALLMVLAAWAGTQLSEAQSWFRGLPLVAVAVVAQAVWLMAGQFLIDRKTGTLAVLMVVFLALAPPGTSPLPVLVLAGAAGWFWFRPTTPPLDPAVPMSAAVPVVVPLAVFVLLLLGLPLLSVLVPSPLTALADGFYQAGALVFGGGHVVLPLLQEQLGRVPGVSVADVLTGYGWAQAMPGPLFSVSAYFGFLVGGWEGAAIAVVSIFLPGLLLILAAVPVWDRLRTFAPLRGALTAVNAAVVGLLAYALYSPLWVQAVQSPADFALAALLFGLALVWKAPAWIIVAAGILGGLGLPLVPAVFG